MVARSFIRVPFLTSTNFPLTSGDNYAHFGPTNGTEPDVFLVTVKCRLFFLFRRGGLGQVIYPMLSFVLQKPYTFCHDLKIRPILALVGLAHYISRQCIKSDTATQGFSHEM